MRREASKSRDLEQLILEVWWYIVCWNWLPHYPNNATSSCCLLHLSGMRDRVYRKHWYISTLSFTSVSPGWEPGQAMDIVSLAESAKWQVEHLMLSSTCQERALWNTPEETSDVLMVNKLEVGVIVIKLYGSSPKIQFAAIIIPPSITWYCCSRGHGHGHCHLKNIFMFCDWWKVEPGWIWLTVCGNLSFRMVVLMADWFHVTHAKGLVQDCIISIPDALEILQSCTKPSILYFVQSVCYIFWWELILYITEGHGQQHISLVYGREGQSGGAIMDKAGWAGIEIDMLQQLLPLLRAISVTSFTEGEWLNWLFEHGLVTILDLTSPPEQNNRHFANIFRCIFISEKFCILIKILLKFVPKDALKISQCWFR